MVLKVTHIANKWWSWASITGNLATESVFSTVDINCSPSCLVILNFSVLKNHLECLLRCRILGHNPRELYSVNRELGLGTTLINNLLGSLVLQLCFEKHHVLCVQIFKM